MGIIGRAFRAAIPRVVIIIAVPIIFAVRFVVFVVVGNEVVQSKSIVRGNKVDAGVRPLALVLVKIRAAGQAVGKLGHGICISLPIAANAIPVFTVPFRPGNREIADHVAPLTDIPWLGDQLHLRQDWVLQQDVEETGVSVTKCSSRPSADARSKRNPSTCISVAQ